jgi:hypothetical protein
LVGGQRRAGLERADAGAIRAAGDRVDLAEFVEGHLRRLFPIVRYRRKLE